MSLMRKLSGIEKLEGERWKEEKDRESERDDREREISSVLRDR